MLLHNCIGELGIGGSYCSRIRSPVLLVYMIYINCHQLAEPTKHDGFWGSIGHDLARLGDVVAEIVVEHQKVRGTAGVFFCLIYWLCVKVHNFILHLFISSSI